MSINPELWGPSFWHCLHWTAAGFPEVPTLKDQEDFRLFLETIQRVLPCLECRDHFHTLLTQIPITPYLHSGTALRTYIMMLHNAVNKRTGSSEMWSLDQVDAFYSPATPSTPSAPSTPTSNISSVVPVVQSRSVPLQTRRVLLNRQRNVAQGNRAMRGVSGHIYVPAPPVRRNIVRVSQVTAPAVSLVAKRKKDCGCNKKK